MAISHELLHPHKWRLRPKDLPDKLVIRTGSYWEQVKTTINFVQVMLTNPQDSVLVILPTLEHPFHEYFWEAIDQKVRLESLEANDQFQADSTTKPVNEKAPKEKKVRQGKLVNITISDLKGNKGDWKAQVRVCGTLRGLNILYREGRKIKGVVLVAVGEMVATWHQFRLLHAILGRLSFLRRPPKTRCMVSIYEMDKVTNWLKVKFDFQCLDMYKRVSKPTIHLRGPQEWFKHTTAVLSGKDESLLAEDMDEEEAEDHAIRARDILFQWAEEEYQGYSEEQKTYNLGLLLLRVSERKRLAQKALKKVEERYKALEEVEKRSEELLENALNEKGGEDNLHLLTEKEQEELGKTVQKIKDIKKKDKGSVWSRFYGEKEKIFIDLRKIWVRVTEKNELPELVAPEEIYSEIGLDNIRRIHKLCLRLRGLWIRDWKTLSKLETKSAIEIAKKLKERVIEDIITKWSLGWDVEGSRRISRDMKLCLVTEDATFHKETIERELKLQLGDSIFILDSSDPLKNYDDLVGTFDRIVINFRDSSGKTAPGVRLLRFISLLSEQGEVYHLASFNWRKTRINGLKEKTGPYWNNQWEQLGWEEMSDLVLALCRITRSRKDLMKYSKKMFPLTTLQNLDLENAFLSSMKKLREFDFMESNRVRDTEIGAAFSRLGVPFEKCQRLVNKLRDMLKDGMSFRIVCRVLRKEVGEFSQGDFSHDIFDKMIKLVADGQKLGKRDLSEAAKYLKGRPGMGHVIQVSLVLTDLLSLLAKKVDFDDHKKFGLLWEGLRNLDRAIKGKLGEDEDEQRKKKEDRYCRIPGRRPGYRVGTNDEKVIHVLNTWVWGNPSIDPGRKFLDSYIHYTRLAEDVWIPACSARLVVHRIYHEEGEEFNKWFNGLEPHFQKIVRRLRKETELQSVSVSGNRPSLIIVRKRDESGKESASTELRDQGGIDHYSTEKTCGDCKYFNKNNLACDVIHRFRTTFWSDIPKGLENRAFKVLSTFLACPWVIPREGELVAYVPAPMRTFGGVMTGFSCPRCHQEIQEMPRPEQSVKCECGTQFWSVTGGPRRGQIKAKIGIEDDLRRDFNLIAAKELPRLRERMRGPFVKGLHKCKFIRIGPTERVTVTPKEDNTFELTIKGWKGERREFITGDIVVDVSDNELVVKELQKHNIKVNHRTVTLFIQHDDKAEYTKDEDGEPILLLTKGGMKKKRKRLKGEEVKTQYFVSELSYIHMIQKSRLTHWLRKLGVNVHFSHRSNVPQKASKELKGALAIKGIRERLIWTHSAGMSLSIYFALLYLSNYIKDSITKEEVNVEIQKHLWIVSDYLSTGNFSRMKRNSLEGRGFFPFVRTIRKTAHKLEKRKRGYGPRIIDPEIGRTKSRKVKIPAESPLERAAAMTPYDAALTWMNQRLRRKLRLINARIGYGYNTVPLFSHTSRDRRGKSGHLDLEEVGRIITRLELLKQVSLGKIEAELFEERLDGYGYPYFVPKLIATSVLSRVVDDIVLPRKIRYKGEDRDFVEAHKIHAKDLYDYMLSAAEIIQDSRMEREVQTQLQELDKQYTPLVFVPVELLRDKKDSMMLTRTLRQAETVWFQAVVEGESKVEPDAGESKEIYAQAQVLSGLFGRIRNSLGLKTEKNLISFSGFAHI